MKKFFYILPLVALFIAPGISFGAVSYTRTPGGSSVSSPINISVSFDDIMADAGCTGDTDWNIGIISTNFDAPDYLSPAYTSSTLTANYNFSLASGPYYDVTVVCDGSSASTLEGTGSFPPDPLTPIFTIVSASSIIGFPPVVPALTARISDTVADPGLQAIVLFVISVPIVFWIIIRIKKLFPSPDPKDPTK